MTSAVAVDSVQPTPAPPARMLGLFSHGRLRRAGVLLAGVVLIAAWLGLLYQLSWRVFYDSDHANTVLAGRDFIGNPLLRGWVLPGDPYWLTYLPLFGVAAVVFGTGPTALHAVPVLVTGGLLAAAWWALSQGARGSGRWLGLAFVAVLVGLPHPVLAQFLLANWHVGTALECLVAAVLLARHSRRPAWWVLGVLVLAAAVISDPFGLTIGVLPVACAGAAAGLRVRRWAPLVNAASAAALAGALALLARPALRLAGGFGLAPALPLAPASSRLDNLRGIPEVLGALLGVGPAGGLSGATAAVRAVAAAAFLLGVVLAAIRLVLAVIRGSDRREEPGPAPLSSAWLDDVLLAGTCGGLATFVVVTLPPRDILSSRYLIPTLIFGAILAGRQLAWVADRFAARSRAVLGAAVLTLVAALIAPVSALDDPRATNPGRALVPWLKANGLHAGYGPYWTASIVTVESDGLIPVRPVIAVDGRLRGYVYYSTRGWFRGGSRPGRWFLVYDADHPSWGVDDQTARATFGPPDTTARYGVYRILVWNHDLSAQLGQPYRDPERSLGCCSEARQPVDRLRA